MQFPLETLTWTLAMTVPFAPTNSCRPTSRVLGQRRLDDDRGGKARRHGRRHGGGTRGERQVGCRRDCRCRDYCGRDCCCRDRRGRLIPISARQSQEREECRQRHADRACATSAQHEGLLLMRPSEPTLTQSHAEEVRAESWSVLDQPLV